MMKLETAVAGAENVKVPPSRAKLASAVLGRSVAFTATFAALVFLPAGTWRFWQAWIFGLFYIVPIVVLLLWLVVVDPQAARRRLEDHERDAAQRRLVRYSWPLFLAAFLSPGLDYRFGWTRVVFQAVPPWVSIAADFAALAGILLAAWSIWVNRFAARTIRVEEDQPLIDSGPYRAVRHPMYAGMILSQLAVPLAMGSVATIPLFVLLIPFFLVRLVNEEKLLKRSLVGYAEYCERTPWRLVPLVW